MTWPIGVQIALGVLVTASLFFLLGRWSHAGASVPPPALASQDQARPGLDLNRATKAELRLIPGIGEALAQRIVDYRDRNGDFRTVDELRKVTGIGPKTLERIRHHLFIATEESFVSEEEPEMPMERARPAPTKLTASKKASELKEPIDVNRATQAELQKLPGIGPKLSQRILDERAKKLFKSADDLRRVPGIGPKTLEKLRPYVTVGP
jgi:competence protein ComEA